MFRGKESSNRIESSRLVQDLLNFGVLGSLWLWGWGGGCMGMGGVWGVPHTHMHRHAHAHACVVNMIISCKWPPPLGESLGIPYDVIRTCTCVCMCVHACTYVCTCVGGTLSPPPTHIHPPSHPPGGAPPESIKIQ